MGDLSADPASCGEPTKFFLNKNCQLSRGKICVANFIPPANGGSQGNYFLAKIPKMAVFEAKMQKGLTETAAAPKPANFFKMVSIFEFMRLEAKK